MMNKKKNVQSLTVSKLVILCIVCIGLFISVPITGYTQANPSYKSFVMTKVIGYIYNFYLYTEWQDSSIMENNFIISVFSEDDEAETIYKILHGKVVNGITLNVYRVDSVENLKKSNMIYIAQDIEVNKEEIFKKADEWKAITFGYDTQFVKSGGMVQFLLNKESVDFKINLDLVKKNNIEIHPRALRLSK